MNYLESTKNYDMLLLAIVQILKLYTEKFPYKGNFGYLNIKAIFKFKTNENIKSS